MPEGYIRISDTPVMRVRADMKGKGPPAAFGLLESRLPTLRGRRFYAAIQPSPDGGEEYWACVARVDADDPAKMQLETGVIPGGWYARRKVLDWEKVVDEGRLPAMFDDMVRAEEANFDPSRPSVEFYRSQEELLLMVPVKGPPSSKVG